MRVAIMGVGRMGRRHIEVVRDLALDLVGICDSNAEALATAEKEQGVREECQFQDAFRLFDSTSPECVIVATTAPTHCEYTCLAAEAGARFILCEKPMGISLAECDRMLAVCAQHATRLAINHPMRFMEQYVLAKDFIQSKECGGLSSVTVVGGNVGLAMNGTHYFEMFRYMTDESPQEVTAWLSPGKVPNPRGPQFEDRAGAVRVTTATGKRLYMDISSDQGHGIKIVYAGPYGQVLMEETSGRVDITFREEQYRDLPSTRYGMPSVEVTKSFQTGDAVGPSRAVLGALLNGDNPPTGEDGRRVVAVLVAAYVSDESDHAPVRLDNWKLPRDRTFRWA